MEPTILAALLPAAIEAIKAGVQWIRPTEYKPQSIDDVIKIASLDIDRFKALNDSDGAAQWVINVIKMQRPCALAVILAMYGYCQLSGTHNATVENLTSAAVFYLFGERALIHSTAKQK